MEKLKISLIIPAYNEEKYIRDCLGYAIKNSAGKFFEIIVIDNASTDQTGTVANSFTGVKVFREEKRGLTSARQRGFREASGEILAYIDADTHMPAGWVDMILNEFQKNPDLACLSGPYTYYDIPRWQQLCVKFYWNILALPMYYIIRYMIVGGNFAIRKDILKKIGGFDISISFYGEDTDIARRAHSFGKILFKLKFIMPTSGRRFFGQGFIKTGFLYVVNFLSEIFLHKPVTKKYEDIRN